MEKVKMLKKIIFSGLLGIVILGSFGECAFAECTRLGEPCTCPDNSQANCVPAPASDISFSDFKCSCENSK